MMPASRSRRRLSLPATWSIAANEDRHIYAIDRQGGNQKWRQAIDNRISQSPAIQNSDVFAIDEQGIVYAVRESQASVDNCHRYDTFGQSSPLPAIGCLWSVATKTIRRLRWIRLDNGDIQQTFDASGQDFLMPAIGDQMIYVAGSRIWALESSVIEIEDRGKPGEANLGLWRLRRCSTVVAARLLVAGRDITG